MEQGIFNSTYQYLVNHFETKHLPSRNSEPKNMLAKRAESFQVFNLKGFPSVKNEEWKYTNLNRILKEDFHFNDTTDTVHTDLADVPDLGACRIVFQNGRLSPELSGELPEGMVFLNSDAAISDPFYAEKIGSIAQDGQNSMLAFNTAFFKNVYVLHVKAKKLVERPIHFVHFFSENVRPALIPYRILVIAEALSESTLIETFHSDASAPVFVSYVSEFEVAESAVLHTHLINAAEADLHLVHHREVAQKKNSTFNNTNLSLGNVAFQRNDLICRLQGVATQTNLYGSYAISGTQHVDNHTLVDHQMPNCNSVELYKGIMMERSHGVFNGKIFVQLDAQKTNAFQQNNNLLLSDQATINSKPQLEIFADDVKCSHGSTVGQMDEQALFYLKARGIGEERAKQLLIEAFVTEVHSKLGGEALQEYAYQLLRSKLKSDRFIAIESAER